MTREEHCGKHFTAELFSRGCADQIHMWFIERLYIIGIIGLIVAFIQVFNFLLYHKDLGSRLCYIYLVVRWQRIHRILILHY